MWSTKKPDPEATLTTKLEEITSDAISLSVIPTLLFTILTVLWSWRNDEDKWETKWLAAKADEFLFLKFIFSTFTVMVHFHFRFKRPIEAAASNNSSVVTLVVSIVAVVVTVVLLYSSVSKLKLTLKFASIGHFFNKRSGKI